jgi:hypothetical protein
MLLAFICGGDRSVCLMGGFSCLKVDFIEHCSDFSDCDWVDGRYINIRCSGYSKSSNCENNEECGVKNCDMVVMSSNSSFGSDDSKNKKIMMRRNGNITNNNIKKKNNNKKNNINQNKFNNNIMHNDGKNIGRIECKSRDSDCKLMGVQKFCCP